MTEKLTDEEFKTAKERLQNDANAFRDALSIFIEEQKVRPSVLSVTLFNLYIGCIDGYVDTAEEMRQMVISELEQYISIIYPDEE